jgi:hypothetical protein
VTLTVATVGVGAVASTVIDNAADVVALPAASVSVTVKDQTPSASVPRVHEVDEIVQDTLEEPFVAVTTAVPEEVETLIVGVLSEVMLSVSDVPALSDAVARSGVEGVLGAVVSITIAFEPAILFAPLGTDVSVMMLPAASTGAEVSAYDETVKSALVSPAATV